MTATVEGNTTEETVTLDATPAGGGSEDASQKQQRKRKKCRLFRGAQKRLVHQAFESYLMPKHDVIPEHFMWRGRKDRLAELTRQLSGQAATLPAHAEEGAACHDPVLTTAEENGVATRTSPVVEAPHGESVL